MLFPSVSIFTPASKRCARAGLGLAAWTPTLPKLALRMGRDAVSVHWEAPRHPHCRPWSAGRKFPWAEPPGSAPYTGFSGAKSQRALDLSNSLPAPCLGKNSIGVEVLVRTVPLCPARRGERRAAPLTAVPQAGRWWASWVPTGPDPGKGGIGLESRWDRGRRMTGPHPSRNSGLCVERGRTGQCPPERGTNCAAGTGTQGFHAKTV